MACPDCGSAAGDFRFVTSVETHGLDCGPYETFNEEFIVCLACGGRFDLREWDGTPEEPPSFRDGGNLTERDVRNPQFTSSGTMICAGPWPDVQDKTGRLGQTGSWMPDVKIKAQFIEPMLLQRPRSCRSDRLASLRT